MKKKIKLIIKIIFVEDKIYPMDVSAGIIFLSLNKSRLWMCWFTQSYGKYEDEKAVDISKSEPVYYYWLGSYNTHVQCLFVDSM